MPIRPFLAGQPFDPETIDAMSRALKSVCEELGLISVVDDPATRAVAKNIIECARARQRQDLQAREGGYDQDVRFGSGIVGRPSPEDHLLSKSSSLAKLAAIRRASSDLILIKVLIDPLVFNRLVSGKSSRVGVCHEKWSCACRCYSDDHPCNFFGAI